MLPDLHTGFSKGRSGVWYSHLFQNFPQFIVIHTVKGFGIVNKTEIDVSFRYDLNQIPNDYTMEVRNSFKGLDLIDRVPEELWTEVHDIVQEGVIKTIPPKMKCKKQNGCLRRPYK